jgi:hypothetical protein
MRKWPGEDKGVPLRALASHATGLNYFLTAYTEVGRAVSIIKQMKTKWVFLYVSLALVTSCTTSQNKTGASPPAAVRKPGSDANELTRQWLNAARQRPETAFGTNEQAQIHREMTALVQQWQEAYNQRDSTALEKILADDFTGIAFSGQMTNHTQTKVNALVNVKLSQVGPMTIDEVTIRANPHFPVVTWRSTAQLKAGTETITFEILSSVQCRQRSTEEARRGLAPWVVTSAYHMPVHQVTIP